MPANKGGDSKQGLIIALVAFVVLTLLFAVWTFVEMSSKNDAIKAKEEAEKKAKEADSLKESYKAQALVAKAYIAPLQSKEDIESLPVLYAQFESKEEFAKLTKLLDNTQDWDPAQKNWGWVGEQKKPKNTYTQELARLNNELKNATARKDKAEQELKAEKAKAENDVRAAMDQAEDWKKKFEAAHKENLDFKAGASKDLDEKLAEFNSISAERDTLKKTLDTERANFEKTVKRLETQVRSLELQKVKLTEKLTPPDLMKYDTPKGKIVRLDPKGEMAWIDVGSEDNVDPNQNLTFSVWGTGMAGKPATRKGAVEVVDVRGPHQSMCKITEVVDPGRDPFVIGDVLINPAWSPGMRQHVAIAGLIDLTGSGKDEIDEFVRTLKKQGVIIDAYLDLKDLTVKGDGTLNLKTNYLIVGEIPEFTADLTVKEGDPRVERKKEILDKISGMQTEAAHLGVTVVPFQRFVAVTGYRMPRRARIEREHAYDSFLRQAGSGEGKETIIKKREKPAKEEKKEENDKKKEEKEDKEDKDK